MPSFKLLFRLSVNVVFFFTVIAIQSCKDEPIDEQPGNTTVIIESFAPIKGPVGTVVIITGTNFSTASEGNEVSFNGVKAIVTAATATSITTKVPANATTGKIHLIADKKNVTSVDDFFVVLPPTITLITPPKGPIGSLVTISGKNFSLNANQNKVTIGDITLPVSNPTLTSIDVTIPAGTTTGKINVQVNGFTVTSVEDFVITPLIEIVNPQNGPVGTVVTITGSGFNPTIAGNVVKFATVTATVSEATSTSLKVTVPAGAFTGRITVTTAGNSVESRSDFVVN